MYIRYSAVAEVSSNISAVSLIFIGLLYYLLQNMAYLVFVVAGV